MLLDGEQILELRAQSLVLPFPGEGLSRQWGQCREMGQNRHAPELFKGAGIVGMGRIGQAIARRARGFGMSIHYHNRRAVHPDIEKSLEATHWDDLGQMLSRMDIVSVNCPHTQSTHHLLSREMLSRIPAQAYVVNTSRGEVIDEIALADLLEDRKIAGAGLDVYENEPVNKIFLKNITNDMNCILSPHIAGVTEESNKRVSEFIMNKTNEFFS